MCGRGGGCRLCPVSPHIHQPCGKGTCGSFREVCAAAEALRQWDQPRGIRRLLGWRAPSCSTTQRRTCGAPGRGGLCPPQPPVPLHQLQPQPRGSAHPPPAPSRANAPARPRPQQRRWHHARPSPRRPGSGCSAGAPAASGRTAGRAAGRWAASGTGYRSPALQGKVGRATGHAERVPQPCAHRVPEPGPGSRSCCFPAPSPSHPGPSAAHRTG